jgi:hypothetical protein
MIVHLKNGPICIFELDSDQRSTANIPADVRLVSFASSDWATYETGDNFGFFKCKDWDTCKMKLTNHVQYQASLIKPAEGAIHMLEWLDIMIECMGVSSDGRIAIIRNGHLLSVWDLKADRFLGHLVGHSSSILAIGVQVLKSSNSDSGFNGKYSCISVSSDGTIRVWDLDPLLEGQTYFMQGWTSCLVADQGLGPGRGWTARGNWIKNEEGDYLFFILFHCPFRHLLNMLVIGWCHELDMTHFVYGEQWAKCREPICAIEDEGKAAVPASELPSLTSQVPVASVISA